MSGKPVHREAAEAGTYAAQTVFINKRLFCHFIDCCEIIFHALAAIIAADSFVPFITKAGKSATIRGNDDIVISCHNLEVPAITPKLTNGALWPTFTEE